MSHVPRSRLAGVVLLCPVRASAQTVLTLADVLATAREQAPQIVSARLAVAEARGRVAGASLRLHVEPGGRSQRRAARQGGTRDRPICMSASTRCSSRRAAGRADRRRHAQLEQGTATAEETTRTCSATRRGRSTRRCTRPSAFGCSPRRRLGERSIFEAADRRFRAGDLAVLDVNLARASLARARAQREAGEAEQAAALGALRALLRIDGPDRGAGPAWRRASRQIAAR